MFDISWINPGGSSVSKESLQRENSVLKRQIQELLTLDETGFFIELDSLLKAILKKALVLCKAESSFFSLSGKDPSDLDVRISNLILEEKMEKIRQQFKIEYLRWQESEAEMLTVEDFILLPLVRRHRMLGVIGLKLTSDAPDNICEILPILAAQAAASLESAILYERMFKRLLVLSNVFILGKEIVSNIELQPLVEKFLSIACDGTDSDIACIFLLHDKDDRPYYSYLRAADTSLKFADECENGYTPLIKAVRSDEKHRIITELIGTEFSQSESSKIAGLTLRDTLVLPLKPRDRLLGVIQVANKRGNFSYRPEDLDLLKILGSQVAFVIQNADLFKNLQRAYIDTLSALTSAIDAKDSYTRGHSERVTELSIRLAEAFGVPAEEVEKIKLGGLLHDIGKIGIPEGILNKPGRLDDEEFEIIKSHPDLGVRIMGKVEFLAAIVPIIKFHHERYDGKGYPEGLSGENIPLLARIVSVVDTFDAMTTDRPYRKAMTIEAALAEIERCAGSQFDPEIAVSFVRMVKSENEQRQS
ncbi:MAG: HD domain-containing protein [Candidatus Riflebacteria bacterium]|nr:HD domain-containing protein [Candidatus Riflebacteria bacterium]